MLSMEQQHSNLDGLFSLSTVEVMSETSSKKSSSALDVWALGIIAVVGGQSFLWNVGLVAGTANYGLGIFLMGMAYLCMVLSIAEVVSAISFPGGVYCLARCMLGFYLGFMAGCCELLEYTLFVTSCNLATTQILATRWPILLSYAPLVWLVNKTLSFGTLLIGGRLFWRFVLTLANLAVMVFLVYYLGAMSFANISLYGGGKDNMFIGGFANFFTVLPVASWMFIGIEALSTLSNDLTEPKRLIPKGQIASLLTLLVMSWCTFMTSISLPPGAMNLASAVAVMNGGFSSSFNITEAASTLLSLPAGMSSSPTFALAASNILVAMAQSKLVPSQLATTNARFKTHANALLVILVVSSGMCFCLLSNARLDTVVYNMGMIFGFLAHMAHCLGFIYLRWNHSHIKRLFVSPVGIPGAIFAMFAFALSLVSTLFFQDDGYASLLVCVVVLGALSIYYVVYAKHRQTFSADENSLLFAHIAKNHTRTMRRSTAWLRISLQAPSTWFSVEPNSSSTEVRTIQVKPMTNAS
ncbi:hypothetical protein AC1031_003169 [Aphanomyces cochlioides]|nr:hypothetical protein AC1031_003169 [Aphanomyces cochlioides]